MRSSKLQVLIGMPLWNVAHAADMPMLQFGSVRTIPASRGGSRKVGDYALHVQCPLVLDVQGAGSPTLAHFIAISGPVSVLAIKKESSGSLHLHLERQATLRILADPHSDEEQWRLLRPGVDEPHLVFRAGQLVSE